MLAGEPTIVVIGAGIGGLSCAIDLAAAGCRVRVLERAPVPGGKARGARVGGADMDGGPTVLTMPWVFDALFDRAGGSFRQEVPLERAERLARHAWPDGTRLDLHADRAASADAIGAAFGAREARAYRAFCDDTRRIFETVEGPFLRDQRPTFRSVLRHTGVTGLGAFARIDALRTVWRALERRFDDGRLRQLFGRYATYCGSSPFEAAATLNLVSHVEAEGVFRVRGGVRALPRALEGRARRLGVELHYGAHVDRIVVEGGRAVGALSAGELHRGDAVVFAGDVSAVGAGLLGAGARRAATVTAPRARSLSAFTWLVRGGAAGFPLLHHNVFFSGDYAAEFDDLLRARRAPRDPTVYVCAQDRRDDDAVPPGEEALLILVNAPANGDDPAFWNEPERRRWTDAMERTLARSGAFVLATARTETTPADFHRRFPGTGGALYGPISRGPLAAFERHGAASRLPGLYLAGGSVHPGPGVPMAALSGRLAAARLREDLASTGRSRAVVTSGITSTA